MRSGRTLAAVSATRRTQVDRWLTIAGLLVLLNIPFSYLYFKQLSETIAPRESLWRQIRIASNKANVSGHNALSLESFILPLLSIVALIAVYEYADTGRRRRPHSVPRPARRGISTAEWRPLRSAALADQLGGDSLAQARRRPHSTAGDRGLVFLLVFSAGQVAMGKYGADAAASLAENLPRVAEGFGTYWLGGIIAFDQNRQNPELRYGWDLGKFAKRIANRFGATYSERDRNLEYTKISPSQITNVYTAFLPYYMDHGGMLGVIGLMFLVGFLSAYVYRCAIQGKCWAVFTLGAFVYATVMTVFSEEYFAQIMFWVKAGAVPTMVYFAPNISLPGHPRAKRSGCSGGPIVRVAAYTGGEMVPSARARVRQYIDPLGKLGIAVREYPLPWGNILPAQRGLRPLWIAATAAARTAALTCSWKADVTWISRQFLPAFAPLQALAKRPMILDVDDAVWLNTGGHRAQHLARASDLVVCGNSFLADQFSRWNANVTIIPTAVNTSWYRPRRSRLGDARAGAGLDRHQRQLSFPLLDRGSTDARVTALQPGQTAHRRR